MYVHTGKKVVIPLFPSATTPSLSPLPPVRLDPLLEAAWRRSAAEPRLAGRTPRVTRPDRHPDPEAVLKVMRGRAEAECRAEVEREETALRADLLEEARRGVDALVLECRDTANARIRADLEGRRVAKVYMRHGFIPCPDLLIFRVKNLKGKGHYPCHYCLSAGDVCRRHEFLLHSDSVTDYIERVRVHGFAAYEGP